MRLPTSKSLLALATLAAVSVTLAAPALAADVPMIVKTANGPVQATQRGEMRSYFAIPFAAPPVGDLRWRAPAAAATPTFGASSTRSPRFLLEAVC